MRIIYLKFISMIFLAAVIVGCSKSSQTLGKPIPDGVETVALAELLTHSDNWNGKTVLLKGVVSGQCGGLCDFNLKDGESVVTVFPEGFSLPRLRIGQTAEVYANIIAGEERVVVAAIGIKTP